LAWGLLGSYNEKVTTTHSREALAPSPFDFSAYDAMGRRTAVVEAKRRLRTDSRWAAQYWRSLRERRSIPSSDYFALVVPDRLYIWKSSAPPDATPYEVDARPVLAPYFARVGVGPAQIEPMAFELLVSWWLNDLSRQEGETQRLAPELARSGLLDAIAGARIAHEGMV
jgi:hypothetical protein